MDGKIIIGTELDTKSFEKEIISLEAKLNDIEASLQMADKDKTLFSTSEIQDMEKEAEKLSNRLVDLRKKQSEIGKTDLSGINSTLSNIGNSVENVTKKVGRWALAVFGIRSAYMFVRQAMSTLSQYNEQMATNVEYIRYLLASTLQPVIEYLINLAYKLLTYVGFIAKAWFGVDIFANASADAFNRNKKALAGASKNAKELQKTLTGFDEMNVLQENGSTTAGGGGGGVSMPSLPSFEDVQIPAWVQWIADNKDLIIAIIAGITAALISMKVLGLDPILSLGIGAIITGIILLIQDIIKFIKDPSWENFANILRDLAIILAGVAVAMLAVNAANPVAWIILAIAAVVALASAVIKHWDEIKAVLAKVGSWINDKVIKPVANFFTGLWNGIKNGFNTAINWIKSTFNSVVNFFKNIINTIINLFKIIGTTVGNVIGSAFKAVINGVLGAIESMLNFPIKGINKLLDLVNSIPGVNLKTLSTFKFPRLAKGGIINMPGRGVDYYGANIGERGREGIVPLDNEASLRLIGETMAKYITINASITNTMNGRVISRELQKVQNESSFAFNK